MDLGDIWDDLSDLLIPIGASLAGAVIGGAGMWLIDRSAKKKAKEEGIKLGRQEISREYEKKLREMANDFFIKEKQLKSENEAYREQRNKALNIAKETQELAAEAIMLSEAFQTQIDGWKAKGGKAEPETESMFERLKNFASKNIKEAA